MTAAPDDDTLGLNLVYTDPSSSLSSSLNGGVVKKPKRKTKYDRRRERGKLAKLAKDDEKRTKRDNGSVSTATLQDQGDNSSRDVGDNSKTDVGGGSSSLAGIASLLGGSSVKEQKKRKTASSQSKPSDTSPTIKPESTEEKKQETTIEDSEAKPKAKDAAMEEDTKISAVNSAKEESKSEAAPSTSAQSTSLPLVEDTKPSVSLAVEDTTSSSRRHRVSSKSLSKSSVLFPMLIF